MADNDGLFGMGGIGLLVVLLFLMGGGNGFGFGGNGNLSTQMQNGFDNQNTIANQREALTAITNGTAQSVAATNQTFHDMIGYVGDKYNEITRDLGSIQVAQAQALANQNQCCCEQKLLMTEQNAQNKYDALLNTNALSNKIDSGFNSIREKLDANKIEDLQSQVSQLQLQMATMNTVKYPNSWTWNAGASPFCGGCGCGA